MGSNWRDIKVVNNHAFIVSEAGSHGMHVFDLTRLRGLNTLTTFSEPDYHYDRVGNSHNIVMNAATNRVFIVGDTDWTFPGNCLGKIYTCIINNFKRVDQILYTKNFKY